MVKLALPTHHPWLNNLWPSPGDAVQLVFSNAGLSPQTLLRRYPQMNELGAFIAARLACSMRVRDHNKSNMVLGLAQAHVSKCSPSPCKEWRVGGSGPRGKGDLLMI